MVPLDVAYNGIERSYSTAAPHDTPPDLAALMETLGEFDKKAEPEMWILVRRLGNHELVLGKNEAGAVVVAHRIFDGHANLDALITYWCFDGGGSVLNVFLGHQPYINLINQFIHGLLGLCQKQSVAAPAT